MKKFLFLLLFVSVLFSQDNYSRVGLLLKDVHHLLEFSEDNYFIFNESSDEPTLMFIWENNIDKDFVTSVMPMSSLHVKFIENGKPFVKFRWEEGSETRIDLILEKYIIYVQINCTNEQWMNIFKTKKEIENSQQLDKMSWEKN